MTWRIVCIRESSVTWPHADHTSQDVLTNRVKAQNQRHFMCLGDKLATFGDIAQLSPLARNCALASLCARGHNFNGAPGHSFNGSPGYLIAWRWKNVFCKNIGNGIRTHNLENLTIEGAFTSDLWFPTLNPNQYSTYAENSSESAVLKTKPRDRLTWLADTKS